MKHLLEPVSSQNSKTIPPFDTNPSSGVTLQNNIPLPEGFDPIANGLHLNDVHFDQIPIFPSDVYNPAKDKLALDWFEIPSKSGGSMALGATLKVVGSQNPDAQMGFTFSADQQPEAEYSIRGIGSLGIQRFKSKQEQTLSTDQKVTYQLQGSIYQHQLNGFELILPVLKRDSDSTLRATGEHQHLRLRSAEEATGSKNEIPAVETKETTFFHSFRPVDRTDLEKVEEMSGSFRGVSQVTDDDPKWSTKYFGYTTGPHIVKDGVAQIEVTDQGPKTPWGNKSSLRSKQGIQYGYFEIEAKLPANSGATSAFWLQPVSTGDGREVDGFERGGTHMLLFNAYSNDVQKWGESTRDNFLEDLTDSFHKYAIDSTPDGITWLVDDKIVAQSPFALKEPMYLMVDAQTGYWNHPVPIQLPQIVELKTVTVSKHGKY